MSRKRWVQGAARKEFGRSLTHGEGSAGRHNRVRATVCWLALATLIAALAPASLGSTRLTHAAVLRPDPPTVTMVCQQGQFDINTTNAASIVSTFGIGLPVAQRWVSEGPWLQPSDLLTVQGIGPVWLSPMIAANRLCATPPSTPPPTSNPCTGNLIDVQTATAVQLTSAFGISSATATRLILARPFQSLGQITAGRVPGVGSLTQGAILQKGCLTPASIITSIATWRWAYADTATTDKRGAFALSVPAGTITTASGAWLSISDAATPGPLTGPTADFRIWGAWSNVSPDSVTVTLPVATVDSTTSEPVLDGVIHYSSDGLVLYGPAAAVLANGAITVRTDSLSSFRSIKAPKFLFTTLLGGAMGQVTQAILESNLLSYLQSHLFSAAAPPSCLAPTDPWFDAATTTTGSAISTVDHRWSQVPLLSCKQEINSSTAEWKFTNNLAIPLVLTPPTSSSVSIPVLEPSSDLVMIAVYQLALKLYPYPATPTTIVVPPGGTVEYQLKAGSQATFNVAAAPSQLILDEYVLQVLSSFLGNIPFADLVGAMYTCGWAGMQTSAGIAPLLDCILAGMKANKIAEDILVPLEVLTLIATSLRADYDYLFQLPDTSSSVAISFVPPVNLTITTTTLNDAVVGSLYAETLQATGGSAPYSWALTSGSLPDGLHLYSATGAIAGTPTTAGDSTFGVTVTDSSGATAAQGYSLTVNGGTFTQIAPFSGATTFDTTGCTDPAFTTRTCFTDQLLTSGQSGTVTFTTTTAVPGIIVSPVGAVSVGPYNSVLGEGTYTVSGTDSDTAGDTGTWTYTLTVSDGGPCQSGCPMALTKDSSGNVYLSFPNNPCPTYGVSTTGPGCVVSFYATINGKLVTCGVAGCVSTSFLNTSFPDPSGNEAQLSGAFAYFAGATPTSTDTFWVQVFSWDGNAADAMVPLGYSNALHF
jgi:DNA uptake protein ComE-like DNA-binding protein